jgi:hypothetical protein
VEILVVGVHHVLQDPNPSGFARDVPPGESDDKARFRQMLEKVIISRGVSIIGEEQLQGRETIPRRVADALGIQHEYVEMSREERARRGIPENYACDCSLPAAQVQAYHREREAYWVARIEALAPANASCVLVCGRDHIDSLATLLVSRQHIVDRVDVASLPEFDLNWVKRSCT